MIFVSLIGGFVLLLVGGETLVRGAVGAARRFSVSPLLIGLTLVGFGTSTPELITSIEAALRGSPGIAVGNVVGSNIANILLVCGLSALVFPIPCEPKALIRDGTMLVLSSLAFTAVAWHGMLLRPIGVVFLTALAGYVVYCYHQERRYPNASAALHEKEALAIAPPAGSLGLFLAMAAAGIGLTIAGAKLLVEAAIALATMFGVSETIIGLTIVAVGTSLPELVTAVIAAVRRQSDVALGNVIGSNIYNLLGILGTTAIVQPVPVPSEILHSDLWIMLAATALLFWFGRTSRRLSRAEGGFLLCGYALYIAWLGAGVLQE
jgi:cation:H+ antiporter